MTPKEILVQMFTLQQQLNNETNGEGWESGYTKNNKLINWKRCIYMECAELIDSFAWKHWKNINAPTDWNNVKVEIVDIWHFIMSLFLEHYKNNSLGDIEKISEDISSTKSFGDFCTDAKDVSESDSLEIVNDVEEMMHITTGYKFDYFDELLISYFKMSTKCGINLNELYTFYLAKNVLNKFRQDHGYQEGSYKKTWNGKEDNEVMVELLGQKNMSIEETYRSLEQEYSKVV